MSSKDLYLRIVPVLACVLWSCGKDDPATRVPDGGAGGDAQTPGLDVGTTGVDVGELCPTPNYLEDVARCLPTADDYQPRLNGSAGDGWPACVSDDNVYHPINPSISSIARVAAFEDIATRLWVGNRVPSAQDFIDARVAYAQDQGLDSRVQRREDIHYAAAPEACSTAEIPALYPDRCVGPAQLLPILNDAFARGSLGETPAVQAARIEAALLWFLYVSPLSEVVSCADKPQDCDSSWAYYTGGTVRESPLGLARYVNATGSETHNRIYDGNLAVRCWRNLDNETGKATNLTMRGLALGQLDRALLRGIALVVRQRFAELPCLVGDTLQARWAFLTTVVPFLDRAARERDATMADALKAQVLVAGPELVNVRAAVTALDSLFPCP